jgi:putative N6-adenine-specific DNA methylase
MFQACIDEAMDLTRDDIPFEIAGSDIDPSAIQVAEAAVKVPAISKGMSSRVRSIASSRA